MQNSVGILFVCFNNPNTAVPSAFASSPNLCQDYSSIYYLHAHPSSESSELILSSYHLSVLPAVGFLCWFVCSPPPPPSEPSLSSLSNNFHPHWAASSTSSRVQPISICPHGPSNKMHIILWCSLPALVVSSWWLSFYQSGVAFLLCS